MPRFNAQQFRNPAMRQPGGKRPPPRPALPCSAAPFPASGWPPGSPAWSFAGGPGALGTSSFPPDQQGKNWRLGPLLLPPAASPKLPAGSPPVSPNCNKALCWDIEIFVGAVREPPMAGAPPMARKKGQTLPSFVLWLSCLGTAQRRSARSGVIAAVAVRLNQQPPAHLDA